MANFPTNDIMALIGPAPRHDLAESLGPGLHLHDVLGADDIALDYGAAEGDPRLRAMIADRNGVDPDDVVVTAGGLHALFLLAFILCDRGGEAVTTAPLFPLARSTLEAVGADIRTVKLDFGQRYRPDAAELGALLSSRTKLVSLASPQNPSGVTIPAATIQALLKTMHERCPEAYLLVDETYREATYGRNSVVPSFVGLSSRIISVASLSKCHGAPGLRIGWAITRDRALRKQLIAGKFTTVIACSTVDEALALRVLMQDQQERRDHFAACLALTAAWVERNQDRIEWVRPDAGAICCVRLRPDVFDETGVGRSYANLESQGVRVSKGSWFGDVDRVFRLGFGLRPQQDLISALGAVSAALKQQATA